MNTKSSLNIYCLVLLTIVFCFGFDTTTFALSPEDEATVQTVQKVRDSVVNIFTETVVSKEVMDPADAYFNQFFGGRISRGNRIVQVPVRSLGSGVVVSPKGYIVTNHHVVERAANTKIKVTLNDKTEYEAKLILSDEDLDLALIQIKSDKPFPYLDLNKLSPNLLGQTVIAIGNPIGYENSVSKGILSAKDRSLTMNDITQEGLIQTDAAINPGNSGGPLVDLDGGFVGLSSAKMAISQNIPVENIGFAIPGERVRVFVADSIDIAEGRKQPKPVIPLTVTLKAKFGIDVQELDQKIAGSLGYRPLEGLLVSNVDPDSPAQKAGLERGMVIMAVGPYRVRQLGDLPRRIARLKTGEDLQFSIKVVGRQGNTIYQRSGNIVLKAK